MFANDKQYVFSNGLISNKLVNNKFVEESSSENKLGSLQRWERKRTD